jgi:hypothetical protein
MKIFLTQFSAPPPPPTSPPPWGIVGFTATSTLFPLRPGWIVKRIISIKIVNAVGKEVLQFTQGDTIHALNPLKLREKVDAGVGPQRFQIQISRNFRSYIQNDSKEYLSRGTR